MAKQVEHWPMRGVIVTGMCFLLNMFDGVNVFTLTYVAPVLQKQFGVGAGQFSIAFSSGLIGMALGGLVLAPQADRWGRRPVILLALALMAGAMILSSYASGVWSLAAARLFVGVGIGTVLASITALSAAFAPDSWRHVAAGVPQAGYPIGATIAGFVTVWALPHYGWQGVFVGAGCLTLLLLPLCFWMLPEAPETANHVNTSIADALGGKLRRNTALLWGCTIGGFMALYFIASWITKLAIQAGLPPTEAIIASAIYNAGACVGTVALSFAAIKYDIRKLVAGMLSLAAGLFLVFGGVSLSLVPLLGVSFLIGVTLQGGVNGNYPLVASVYPAEVRATGLGWAMGVGRAGALLGPMIGGWALGAGLPLVWVFAIFCVPLLLTAICATAVRLDH